MNRGASKSTIDKVVEKSILTDQDRLIEANINQYCELLEKSKNPIAGNITDLSTKSSSSLSNKYKSVKPVTVVTKSVKNSSTKKMPKFIGLKSIQEEGQTSPKKIYIKRQKS